MMRFGLVTVAYNEERFIKPFLSHIPNWIEEKLVLVSNVPWQGQNEIPDDTDIIADVMGATVVINHWKTEEEQRQAGQDYFHDMDWIIVLDPDEFLTKADWRSLRAFLTSPEAAGAPAYVCRSQHTYWKHKRVIEPQEDYKQIIAVRPSIRFIDKRVVSSGYGFAPVDLHHFSWSRTDKELWSKITHYAHAKEFNTEKWYNEVWKDDDRTTDLHPLTPESLKRAIPAKLPKELEELNLWPT
jgi:glycosyltransferase involved in cell wall biosynthesis